MTDVVILVGGRGKRLGKLTLNTPKPLIKVDMFFIIKYLKII